MHCFCSSIKRNLLLKVIRLLLEIYQEYAPSVKTCEYWFRRFKSGDFDLNDKERSGQLKKFEDLELQQLLDED